MSSTAKGPTEHPLGDLTPDQFEALVFLLARDEFPEVVRVRAKDRGLDARRPDGAGGTLRGWQAKRFTGGIKWPQCQESVERAVAFWRPPRITFAFPKLLSAKEQEDFRSNLIEQFPGVRLDWWDRDELQARMRDTEGGRRAVAWLFDNLEAGEEKMRRALAVGGELADARQAAERVAEIQDYVDRDPHLQYTIVSADKNAPETKPAAETIISLEAEFGSKQIRFDGSERYPGAAVDAGLSGRLIFSDDEEGRSAREAVDMAAGTGEPVTITSGLAGSFDRVPIGLRGLLPEGPTEGTVEILPAEAPDRGDLAAPETMSLLVRSAETELGIVLTAVEPPAGQTGLLVGSVGGLELRLNFHGQPGDGEIGMGWRWTPGEGSAREQLLAARLMLAAHRQQPVELFDPGLDRVVVSALMDELDDQGQAATEIEGETAYLGFVAEVEAWIGKPLYPSAIPSDADAKVLGELIGRIRNPRVEGTWKRVELTITSPPEHERFRVAVVRPIFAPLFGQVHYAGGELVAMPEAKLDPESADAKVGDTVAIVPGADDSVSVVFESPLDAPEAALLPK